MCGAWLSRSYLVKNVGGELRSLEEGDSDFTRELPSAILVRFHKLLQVKDMLLG